MIFVRLIRMIMGYIVFTAKGGFPERFINLCARHSVPLWDVKCRGNVLSACTTIKGYKNIRRPARRSGMLPRIKERHGLPFFLHRYRRRAGLLAGACIALSIIFFLSSMIWTVEVEGNKTLESENLMLALEEIGVKSGVRRSAIDAAHVQNRILNKFPELIWASLNIFGSKATLEVREGIAPPDMFDINDPCNIVAAFDGEIIRLDVYSGEATAQPGSAVRKGDLLINGVSTGKTHTSYVHAKGDIIARTVREVSAETEKNLACQRVSEDKIKHSIYIFGIKIPLGFGLNEYGEYSINKSMANTGDTVLPIGILRERFTAFEDTTVQLSGTQAKLICFNEYYRNYRDVLDEAEIVNAEISAQENASGITVSGKYRAEEDIGVEQYFEVEENNLDK